MCSGRETRSLATKGIEDEKRHNTRCAMNRVALLNDWIGNDYSVAVEIMDSDDVLRGR